MTAILVATNAGFSTTKFYTIVNGKFPKRHFLHKNRLFGWLGMLLFVFTVADTTILQYYGGNEALGIKSFNQAVVESPDSATANHDSDGAAIVKSDHSAPDRQHESPEQHSDCICSCAHVLTPDCRIASMFVAVVYSKQVHSSLPKSSYSESHLFSHFRPPRLA